MASRGSCGGRFPGSRRRHGPAAIIIKFSHVVSPDAPKGKAAVKFKELVEKYTNAG